MLSKQHWSSPSYFTGSLERYITIAIAQDQIISKSKKIFGGLLDKIIKNDTNNR